MLVPQAKVHEHSESLLLFHLITGNEKKNETRELWVLLINEDKRKKTFLRSHRALLFHSTLEYNQQSARGDAETLFSHQRRGKQLNTYKVTAEITLK